MKCAYYLAWARLRPDSALFQVPEGDDTANVPKSRRFSFQGRSNGTRQTRHEDVPKKF
jgi:hypothetical protein